MPAAAPVRPWRDPVVAGLALWGLATGLWFLLSGAGPRTEVLVTWLSLPPLDLCLFVLSRRAGRAAPAGSPARRFWRAMAAAAVIFAAGDLSQIVVVLAHGAPGTLTPIATQGAGSVLGTMLVLVVFLRYPLGAMTGAARLSFALDAATVLSAAGVVSWCLLSRPELTVAGPDTYGTAISGFVVLMVGVFVTMRWRRSGEIPVRGPAAVVTVGAAVVQSCASMIVPFGLRDQSPTVQAVLVLLPCFLIALAPRLQERAGDRESRAAGRRRRFSVLPYVATAILFGVLALAMHDGGRARIWVAVTGLFVNFALVTARQLLALRDNNRLLDRLDDSLEEGRRQRNRLESLLRHSSDITSICDAGGYVTYLTPVVSRTLGYSPEEMIGVRLISTIHEQDQVKLSSRLGELFSGPGAQITYQARFRHADGSYRWLDVVVANLLHEPGINGLVSNARDITEARAAQELLQHQAGHDALTGLANRRRLAARMRELGEGSAAVLLIDLDGFKPINDAYGHAAGDEVLLHVAEALRGCTEGECEGDGDGLAARLGGDEFAVLLPGADLAMAERVAARFRAAIAAPVPVAGRLIEVGASIGCAAGPAGEPEGLLNRADQRMYERKRLLATRRAG